MDNMSKILESVASLNLDAAAAAIDEGNGSSFSVVCSMLSFEVTLELINQDEDAQAFDAFLEEILRD